MKIVVVEKKFNVNNLSKYWEIRHNGAKNGISNQPGKPNVKNNVCIYTNQWKHWKR